MQYQAPSESKEHEFMIEIVIEQNSNFLHFLVPPMKTIFSYGILILTNDYRYRNIY